MLNQKHKGMIDIYTLVCSHTTLRNLKCAACTLKLALVGASPLNRENPHSLLQNQLRLCVWMWLRMHTHTHARARKCF